MSPEEKEYTSYRVVRGAESLDEAKLLLEAGHLSTAVNRLYYASFYSVSALLLTEGQSSSKHSGLRSLFDRHWVKTGRIPRELGQFYRRMFDQRHKADYVDLTSFDPVEVASWYEQASRFVSEISKIGCCPHSVVRYCSSWGR